MGKLNRRSFLKMSAVGSVGLFSCNLFKSPPKPNFIFILADDLGYGDLGCYGQKEIKTPNLDQMAREGMLFTDFYAGSTVCAPSRCCLMTGMDTGHGLIRGNGRVPLRSQDTTIGEILKKKGYATGVIGKWGLGANDTTGSPNKKGFDYFYGYLSQLNAHNYYPEYLWENGEKINLENKVKVIDHGYAKGRGTAAIEKNDYSHDLFTQKAQMFIDKNKTNPFFLYLAYTIPHANNEAPGVLNEHGMEVPDYGIYKDKDWPKAQKGHAAMISRMDRDVGAILDQLKEYDIAENTLVIFSSDNGPHKEGWNDPDFNDSNGPLKGMKRDLYEGGIRVPMIAWWPGKIKADTKNNHVSAFWDVLPTFAEFADATVPDQITGLSFAPALTGKIQKPHDCLYWEFHEGKSSAQAIRMKNWKAVRLNPAGPIELYDLSNDIGEKNNIADQHPDIVAQINEILANARTENEHWSLKSL